MRVAGADEAGRGPLAGPVVAAAVVLDREQRRDLLARGLGDSKTLTPRRREDLFRRMEDLGVPWRAQAASAARIDGTHILAASLWALGRALEALDPKPDLAVVDGNTPIPGLVLPQRCVVGGDRKVPAVMAASVVAKVLRDRALEALDRIYPGYGFARHKGYPTVEHRRALALLGPCPVHRATFRWRPAP